MEAARQEKRAREVWVEPHSHTYHPHRAEAPSSQDPPGEDLPSQVVESTRLAPNEN